MFGEDEPKSGRATPSAGGGKGDHDHGGGTGKKKHSDGMPTSARYIITMTNPFQRESQRITILPQDSWAKCADLCRGGTAFLAKTTGLPTEGKLSYGVAYFGNFQFSLLRTVSPSAASRRNSWRSMAQQSKDEGGRSSVVGGRAALKRMSSVTSQAERPAAKKKEGKGSPSQAGSSAAGGGGYKKKGGKEVRKFGGVSVRLCHRYL